MKDNKVVYEIKLEKSVKVILGALALGMILNAVAPDFPIKEALAAYTTLDGSLHITCMGCN